MRPLSLVCENLRSFDRLDLDVTEGLTAVTGPNGAGKSTTVNAIEIALFGAEGRSLAPLLSDDSTGDLLIELEFAHGDDTYRVRRGYSGRGRGKATLDVERFELEWEPLTRETVEQTQALIEQLLGFDRATFRASSFLAQGDGAAFTTAQPRDRKALLASILQLGVYDRLLDLVRADKRTCETKVAELTGAIDRAGLELAERQGLELLLAQVADEQASRAAALEEAEAELVKLNERYLATKGLVERRQGAEHALQLARDAFARQRDSRFAAVYEAWRRHSAHRDALLVEAQQTAARADTDGQRVLRLTVEADEYEVKSMRVTAEVGARCDRCEQLLGMEAARAAADSFQAEAAKRRGEAATLGLGISGLQSKALELRAQAEKIVVGPEPTIATHDFGDSLDQAQKAVDQAQALWAACDGVDPDQLTRIVREGQQAKTEVEAQRARLEAARGELIRLTERKSRLELLAEARRCDEAERDGRRDELGLLAILERAFGRNGIPSLILESTAIPAIETEASRIMAALASDPGHPVRCELLTQRETKTGGLADALDIILYTGNDTARDYSSFSGGERTRADLALRIALARLLANRRGADSQLLVIDEPSGLDEQGMAALVQILRGLQDEFAVQLIVSHVPALRDAFDQTISVEKDDLGRSCIVGARETVTA